MLSIESAIPSSATVLEGCGFPAALKTGMISRMKHIVLTALLLAPLAALRAADPAVAELTPGELEVRQQFPKDTVRFTTIRLWPGEVPDEPRPIPTESVGKSQRSSIIQSVIQPSITVVQPKNATAATPAVLVCPGGGYGSLGIQVGGADVIPWLNQLGIAGVYMKSRVPKRGRDFPMHHQPLQDIQRALSLLRSRAAELQIDPKRIGVIGFSAGGNLAAMLATHHAEEDRLYRPADEADQVSCRPDFVLLVAPAYLTNPILSSTLDPALQLDKVQRNVTPPVFITSTITDKFAVGASHFARIARASRPGGSSSLRERRPRRRRRRPPRQPMAAHGRGLDAPKGLAHVADTLTEWKDDPSSSPPLSRLR